MDLLRDWMKFNSGNMVPERFTMWALMGITGALIGKRIYVDHGYFQVYPNMYMCLVGNQGTRKGTAKDLAMELFKEADPDYPVGASVTTRELIIKNMASNDAMRCFQNGLGLPEEWRPMMFFVNELKNFMSFNPQGMIEFLTDIYDRKSFQSDTIIRGAETIINPCINILACETPQWITDKLKFNIISGGFARRMLFVYETGRPPRITHPKLTIEMQEARTRCVNHLKKIPEIAGKFTWEKDAYEYFDQWFVSLPAPADELLAGYYEAKDILALKLAMIGAVGMYQPKLVFTLPIIQSAIAMLESIEDNLPKLSIAAGRNQLAQPMMKVVEMVNLRGWMFEKELKRVSCRDLTPNEQNSVFNYIREQELLLPLSFLVANKPERLWANFDAAQKKMEQGKWVPASQPGFYTMKET